MNRSTVKSSLETTPIAGGLAALLLLAAASPLVAGGPGAGRDPGGAAVEGGITFTEVAAAVGIDYQRTRSLIFAGVEAARARSLVEPLPPEALAVLPARAHGLPGVAIFDYDRDGDLDLYVTDGPGAPNSLFTSRLAESGSLSFVDLALPAGVAAADQDSTGTCYGDLDNDGDDDLIVLGRSEANRLFENLSGTFLEVAGSGLEGGDRAASSCAVGDVDGDGLLDVVVANSFPYDTLEAIFAVPFALNQHNQLFVNQGELHFTDASAAAGLEDLGGLPPGAASITWAVAVADIDLDGDADIVFGDDQGGIPTAADGGLDRGLIHVLLNDGGGRFHDRPILLGGNSAGSWMGLAVGDLDCDGRLDLFGSNFGDYGVPIVGPPYDLGDQASRWLLGNGDGTFTDPGVGDLVASVFGWGNAILDYDNDGDPDVAYFGGLDLNFFAISDNPGVVLNNQGCSASFVYDDAALAADYLRRNPQGAAAGDLDRDGFVDLVTVSNADFPAPIPLLPAPVAYGSVFDATALFVPVFAPTPAGLVWTGIDFAPGTVTVELNGGGNGNGWAAVTTVGSVGLTAGGRVNRSGIGAVLSFTPVGGPTVTVPVPAGSSYLSQHSLETIFGLGRRPHGTLEVLWPGGVRNRLYGVQRGERLVLPEIPCSFAGGWRDAREYRGCLEPALADLVAAGVIDAAHAGRLHRSALRAFGTARGRGGGY